MLPNTILVARKFDSDLTLYFLSNNNLHIHLKKINREIDNITRLENKIEDYKKELLKYQARKEAILKNTIAADQG